MLSGAGTWLGECKDATSLCDQLQNFFWRVILKVPESCPKVALRSETGMLGMKWRIWQEKIFVLLRIRNHSEDTLCRQIYEEGELRKWPGLGQEVKEICATLDIPDANKEIISKSIVKNAVRNHHYKEMKEEISKMKKLDPIKHEDFSEAQKYLQDKSIENGRTAFKLRSQMLENTPGNFKNKYKNKPGSKVLVLTCGHGVKKIITSIKMHQF